jgi:hypothetical protein
MDTGRTNNGQFDWSACVEAITDAHLKELADWRGYSPEFCKWLRDTSLIGRYRCGWAFPVQDTEGNVIGAHYLHGDPAAKQWRFSPGATAEPFIIGDVDAAGETYCFESQWDAFAFLDRSACYLSKEVAVIITRGAANTSKIAQRAYSQTDLYVWPQNDSPGQNGDAPSEKWLKQIQSSARQDFYRVPIPHQHKDLNDWTRAGATKAAILQAVDSSLHIVRPTEPQILQPEPPQCFDDWENLPLQKPRIIIAGLLDQGSKMSIESASKAGKTFSLLDLGISVATGNAYLGMQTEIGPVFYVNFEVRPYHFRRRVQKIRERKGITGKMPNFVVWHLRGHYFSSKAFREALIKAIGSRKFVLIIIDPFYKLLDGADENKAGDITKILSELERIAWEVGAALVYSHHYSKGNKSNVDAIDRGSGSGVFGRDPDVKMTLTPHEEPDCYSVEFILRDFPRKDPFVVSFDDCLFVRVDSLRPENLKKAAGSKKRFTFEMILEALGNDEISDKDWKARCSEKYGMKGATYYTLKEQAIRSNAVYKSTLNGLFSKTAQQLEKEGRSSNGNSRFLE